MADFDVIIDAGAGSAVWIDPANLGKPSRLNPIAGLPHRNSTVPNGGALTLHALVGGALLADGALGGRLFLWSWVDLPGAPPTIVPTAGTTAEVIFPAGALSVKGHYTILAMREDGGNVGISWEVLP